MGALLSILGFINNSFKGIITQKRTLILLK